MHQGATLEKWAKGHATQSDVSDGRTTVREAKQKDRADMTFFSIHVTPEHVLHATAT